MLYVGNYGRHQPKMTTTPIRFFRLADDIDEDGIPGAGFILDPDGNLILLFTDFDDLHKFNIFFDNVLIRNTTRDRRRRDHVDARSHESTLHGEAQE